jgi:hypothetical protein
VNYYSPIILFIYKRPEHLKKTLESLSNCYGYENYSFFVFGDGPKNQFEESAVQKTRKVAINFLGDKAQYFFAPTNKGLAKSVIHGINMVLAQFTSVIVIEDDLIFHPHFLTYMNSALNKYLKEDKVSMVSGYMYYVPEFKDYQNQLFLPLISTWGWGTWSRAWKNFDVSASGYEKLKTNKSARKKFDCNGSYPFSRMLELQMKGKIDSWGIRWYWSIFKNNGLNCFPPNTLVLNNGFDTTATHGRGFLTNFDKSKFTKDDTYQVAVSEKVPVKLDSEVYKIFCKSMYHLNGGHIGKFRDFLKKFLWDGMIKK